MDRTLEELQRLSETENARVLLRTSSASAIIAVRAAMIGQHVSRGTDPRHQPGDRAVRAHSPVVAHAIDLERVRAQHDGYERALKALDCVAQRLPDGPEMPDAVFVEDVQDECCSCPSVLIHPRSSAVRSPARRHCASGPRPGNGAPPIRPQSGLLSRPRGLRPKTYPCESTQKAIFPTTLFTTNCPPPINLARFDHFRGR